MSSPSEQVGFAASTTEAVEAAFKADTVGLQTREQFAEKRANIEKELAREKEQRQLAAEDSELRQLAKRRAVKACPPHPRGRLAWCCAWRPDGTGLSAAAAGARGAAARRRWRAAS